MYQQLLASLAASGVLVAVASKNDPALVNQAFDRDDLLLKREHVFPVAAGWGAKSESIRQILQAWNIGDDAVVFIDDSPIELAEVAREFPAIECIPFPQSPRDVWTLMASLRDRFGKPAILEEDRLRLNSLRHSKAFAIESSGQASDSFLESTSAVLTFDFTLNPDDRRALELVNKTNQFNLNGLRYTEAEWAAQLRRPGAFLVTVTYEDKFGLLGKIAVLSGRVEKDTVNVDTWVMSCRAFARRIEHQCVHTLLNRWKAREIRLTYRKTERNGPVQEFLNELCAGELSIRRQEFDAHCPALFHTVRESTQQEAVHG